MYSSLPQFVFGFHGCDRSVGEALISGNARLESSKNAYDWLGSGIYFWENSFGRAQTWAKECQENPQITRGKIKDPFVVGAVIDLGKCLNLTDRNYCTLLEQTYHLLKSTYEMAGLDLPQNKGTSKKLDCLVINAAIEAYRDVRNSEFDTVRGAFVEGEPIYPGATLYSQTHIQICVRNPNCIKGYFNPLEASPEFRIP